MKVSHRFMLVSTEFRLWDLINFLFDVYCRCYLLLSIHNDNNINHYKILKKIISFRLKFIDDKLLIEWGWDQGSLCAQPDWSLSAGARPEHDWEAARPGRREPGPWWPGSGHRYTDTIHQHRHSQLSLGPSFYTFYFSLKKLWVRICSKSSSSLSKTNNVNVTLDIEVDRVNTVPGKEWRLTVY